jgi:site-specific recombinase XerD
LSAEFRKRVEAAGITRQVTPREGKGRTLTNKSFHCLRHSFVSRLANAGVASEVRQRLAGHASAESHKLYTHHEIETLRGAIAKLPSLKAE